MDPQNYAFYFGVLLTVLVFGCIAIKGFMDDKKDRALARKKKDWQRLKPKWKRK